MLDIDWKGLALPFAYLIVLGGALMTFSTIYRRRKAGTQEKSKTPQPILPLVPPSPPKRHHRHFIAANANPK